MLYDPKWNEAKTAEEKPKASFEGFIAWLKTKDPKKKYNWYSSTNCAIHQYKKTVEKSKYMDFERPPGFTGRCGLAHTTPHTFGALLARCEAFKKGQ